MMKLTVLQKKVILIILALLVILGIVAIIAVLNVYNDKTPIKAVYVYKQSDSPLRLII